ncbi:MAG: energy-coupling factor transporter ATPase [Clostridia bacterium]|nr:energy-coupling factor transporter ATPase [Clostridia bacterium]
MNKDILIKFNNVTFAYTSYEDEEESVNTPVLTDFSLEIPRGQFIAVLGHNGSGKSTAAKMMNALLVPQSGSVTVDGIPTSDESRIIDIRRKVGMVFQNPDNQLVATIVEDDVAFGPENLGVPPEEIRVRVDNALKAVGMYEFKDREPHKLSGGQKQRVAIAGIITMQTDCIVMDEPTAMLDPRGRKEVMDTIKMLCDELGITVVLITHYMDEAVKADRVVVMNDGKICLDGAPREVFSNVELIKSLGLDVPQATELAYRLNKAGFDIDFNVLDEEECAGAIFSLLEVK